MLIINAELREKQGKSFSRKLRIQNKLPAVLYGSNKKSLSLILDHNSFFNFQKKNNFYKNVLLLSIQEKKYKVKVQSVQRHPFKLKLLHIDFLYV